MRKRVLACLLSVFPFYSGCASPEQYDPADAPGPAVAVAPNDVRSESPPPPSADTAPALVDAQAEAQQPPSDASFDGGSPPAIDSNPETSRPADAMAIDRTHDQAPDSPPEPPPVVVRIPAASAPARLPAGTKVSCSAGPDGLTESDCPVVRWRGYSYWTLSYLDNRSAATVIAYDSTGRIVKELNYDNVRYIWNVEIDPSRREVVLHFQGSRVVAVSWDDLQIP